MAHDGSLLFDTSIDPSGFSDGVAKLGSLTTKAVAAVGAALVGAASAAVAVGKDYETALAKVSTIADTGKVSLEALSSSITDTSSAMGIAASEIAEATYQAISAGQATEDAVAFAGKAAMLAAAGFTSSTTAVDLLTTALNAYGLEADKADHISDVLLTTQNLGKTTVAELASSMGRVIPLAAAYGVNMENLSSALAVLTQNGIATAEATTYTKSMLNELGKSSSDVAQTLQAKTGKSFAELSAAGYSLGDILEILYDAVGKDGTAFSQMWSSVEAGTAALSLATAGAEKFDGVLDQMASSTGTTSKAYAKMSTTLEHRMKILTTQAQNLGIAFYQSTDEQIGGAVDLAIGYLGRLSDAFGKGGLSGLVNEAGEVFADLATEVVNAAPALVNTSVDVIRSFVGGLVSNADKIGEGAIQIIGALARGIADTLPVMADLALQILETLSSGIAANLPTLIGQALPMIQSFTENLRANFGQIVDAGIDLLLSLADGLIEALPDLLAYVPQIIIDLCGLINDNAPKLIVAGIELIGKLIVGIIKSLPDIIAAVPKIVEAIVSVISAFNWLNLGAKVISFFKDGITGMIGAVKSAGENLVKQLKVPIETLPTKLLEIARNAIQQVASAFSNFSWSSIGSNIINGIKNGISSALGGLVSAAASAALSAFQSAKRALGIHSPSRKFRDEIGKMIPPGMTEGVEDAMPKAERTVARQMEDFVGSAQEAAADAQSNAATHSAAGARVQAATATESSVSVTGNTTVVVECDGREIARATAPYMGEQMEFEGR